MKTTIANKCKKSKYPWVGYSKSSDRVVLFTEHRKGVVLSGQGSIFGVGDVSESWDEHKFVPTCITLDSTGE